MVPPDSMPNSEVKRNSADGSVGLPHVRVGHRQVSILEASSLDGALSYLGVRKVSVCLRDVAPFVRSSTPYELA